MVRGILLLADKLMAWKANPMNQKFPQACTAIQALHDALQREMRPFALRKHALGQGRRRTRETAVRVQHWRLKQKRKQLQAEVADLRARHETSKGVGGRVSEEWLLRVIMTAPNVTGRALAEAFHLAVGSDSRMVSRVTIGFIRAAFLEMWKALICSNVREFVAAHLKAATGALRARGAKAATGADTHFVGMYLTHVQDEADLRLLSNDASSGPGLPRRSRSSKVQIHVVRLKVEGKSWNLPQELEALANKSARTLATSFERLVLRLLAGVVPPQADDRSGGHRGPEIWLAHCIIGDGIGTNAAAAKILWALAREGLVLMMTMMQGWAILFAIGLRNLCK